VGGARTSGRSSRTSRPSADRGAKETSPAPATATDRDIRPDVRSDSGPATPGAPGTPAATGGYPAASQSQSPAPGLSRLPATGRTPSLLSGRDGTDGTDSAASAASADGGAQREPNGRIIGRDSNGYEPGSAYPLNTYRS
jgi:hypothetical protein